MMGIKENLAAIVRLIGILILVEAASQVVFEFIAPSDISTTILLLQFLLRLTLASVLIYFMIIRPYARVIRDFIHQINHTAMHDELTDLPNRQMLTEYTEKLLSSFIRHKYYGALLYIDLDGFRIINDHHGYVVGDAVLVEVANRLSHLVRGEDILGRVSSNAFVIVLDQLSSNEVKAEISAEGVTERIYSILQEPFKYKSKAIHIEVSIGQCVITPERADVESIIIAADTDMRQVRRAKKV